MPALPDGRSGSPPDRPDVAAQALGHRGLPLDHPDAAEPEQGREDEVPVEQQEPGRRSAKRAEGRQPCPRRRAGAEARPTARPSRRPRPSAVLRRATTGVEAGEQAGGSAIAQRRTPNVGARRGRRSGCASRRQDRRTRRRGVGGVAPARPQPGCGGRRTPSGSPPGRGGTRGRRLGGLRQDAGQRDRDEAERGAAQRASSAVLRDIRGRDADLPDPAAARDLQVDGRAEARLLDRRRQVGQPMDRPVRRPPRSRRRDRRSADRRRAGPPGRRATRAGPAAPPRRRCRAARRRPPGRR